MQGSPYCGAVSSSVPCNAGLNPDYSISDSAASNTPGNAVDDCMEDLNGAVWEVNQ